MKVNKATVKYNSAIVIFAEVSQLVSTNIPMESNFHLANSYTICINMLKCQVHSVKPWDNVVIQMFSMKPNWLSISELYNTAQNYTRSVYSTLPLSSKTLLPIYSSKESILLPPCNIFTSYSWASLNIPLQNHYVYISIGSCQLPAPP